MYAAIMNETAAKNRREPAGQPQKPEKTNVRALAYVGLFVALIAVCAWISIPTTVPFTLQTFAVLLAAGLLGPKRGTVAVAVYLLLGGVGVPVFSGFRGGFPVLLGPTGGYLVGFLATAFLTGWLRNRFGGSVLGLAAAMVIGLVVCYAFGTAWFLVAYTKTVGPIGLAAALSLCVFPFLLTDAAKLALALLLTHRLEKFIHLT